MELVTAAQQLDISVTQADGDNDAEDDAADCVSVQVSAYKVNHQTKSPLSVY